jgi:hypothetical protein
VDCIEICMFRIFTVRALYNCISFLNFSNGPVTGSLLFHRRNLINVFLTSVIDEPFFIICSF